MERKHREKANCEREKRGQKEVRDREIKREIGEQRDIEIKK